MARARVFRMTIASYWYDRKTENEKEFELHFKVARTGNIRTVRRHLVKRGIPYFQQNAYRLFNRWIPKARIKASFEREQPALKISPYITIEARRMVYRKKHWNAFPLPTKTLGYAKRRRKRR